MKTGRVVHAEWDTIAFNGRILTPPPPPSAQINVK